MATGKRNDAVKPLLKWVGGKRQLLDQIIPLIPKHSTFVEPFVGGGAVLFSQQPKRAIINDANMELMNVYDCVKNCPYEVIEELSKHAGQNSEDYYYQVRSLDREETYDLLSPAQKAARILYLNRTCYNGLFRVNAQGQFNAPYGKYKNPSIVNQECLLAVSGYFRQNSIKMLCGDYEGALKGLRQGAFVYLDPPYMPISSSSSFTGYTQGGFGWDEQVRLKKNCEKLANKGIPFLESNSDCKAIRELYRDFEIITIQARRAINSKGERRGAVNEVLIHG